MKSPQLLTFIGVLLNSTNILIIPIWGNLVIYIKSYFFYRFGTTFYDISIVMIIFALSTSLSMYLLQFLITIQKTKTVIFVLNIFISISYLLIPKCKSMLEFYFLMFLSCVSQKTLMNILNNLSVKIYQDKKSFIVGCNFSASSVSSAIFTILMSYIINPKNTTISAHGNFTYEVSENVVGFCEFLFMYSLIITTISICLIEKGLCEDHHEKMSMSNGSVFKRSSTNTPSFKFHGERFNFEYELEESLTDQENSPNFNFSFEMGRMKERSNSFHHKNSPFKQDTVMIKSEIMSNGDEASNRSRRERCSYENKVKLSFQEYEIESEKNIGVFTKMSESFIIRNYVLSKPFLYIWVISLIRNTSNIYLKNSFKNVLLYQEMDDWFINMVSSSTFLIMILVQLMSGSLIERFNPYRVTFVVYLVYLTILTLLLLYPCSKITACLAIGLIRGGSGICLILNNFILYNLYTDNVVIRLLKYLFLNSLLSSMIGSLMEWFFMTSPDFSPAVIFLFIFNLFGIVIMTCDKVTKFCHS